jgi:hypothetical protein
MRKHRSTNLDDVSVPLFLKNICPHFVPVNSQVANRGAVFAVKFIAFHNLHGQVLGTTNNTSTD